MVTQQSAKKSFFAKYWWIFAGGGALALLALIAAAVLLYMFVLQGKAEVTDLSVSAASAPYGTPIEASVTVANSRMLPVNFNGTLLVDDVEKPLPETTVQYNTTQIVKLDVSGLKPGTHTVSIGELKRDFRILKPAEFKVTGLTIDPAENVVVGGTVTVTATVANTGEVEGAYAAKFSCDGTAMDPMDVTVSPGGEQTLSFSLNVTASGTHTVSLEDQQQSFTALSPASIALTGMTFDKTLAAPGETVSFSVTLSNTGEMPGEYPLEVLVNGQSAYTETVAVEAGSQKDVPLQITEENAGPYEVQVGDYKQTLTIAVITRPKTGELLAKEANGGYCTIVFSNGYTGKDAVFLLASTDDLQKTLLSVYVQAGEETKKIKIKNGSYAIFYSTGTDFDSLTNKFLTNPDYRKFNDTLASSGSSSRWTDFTASIYVSDGNATTEPVDEGNFPK